MNRFAIGMGAWTLMGLASAGAALAQTSADDSSANPQLSRQVTVTIELDDKGRIQDCMVTASSGVKQLDELSCRMIREQGHYEAVLDENGKPIPATIVQTLSWHRDDGKQKQLADMGDMDKDESAHP